MTEKKFSIKIASDTDREKVFAEIYYNEEEWAEISQEGEKLLIALFPPFQGKYWEFPLDEALEAIAEAKKSLL
jgi:hypothetical protein